MSGEQVKDVAENGFMVLAGLYVTLVGFRVVNASKRKGPDVDAWHKKYGWLLKILGPIMTITSTMWLVRNYPR